MRLKGGKLLLDLTGYGEIYTQITNIQHPLSDEEIDCIKSKGLNVKVNFAGHIIIWNLPLREYDTEDKVFYTTIKVDSSDYSRFVLNTNDKKLEYNEI